MDLKECLKKGLIKHTNENPNLILSLIKISNTKEIAITRAKIDEITISAYLSLAYDSFRGILEAICLKKGYKVLSHICLGYLLKDEITEFDYAFFDRIRKIRNGINYYGDDIDFKQGTILMNKILKLKNQLIKTHLNNKL